MTNIDILFEAVKAMANLESQLAKLRLGLPVPRQGGGIYSAGDVSADLYQWWELQLVRETFNQMLVLTRDLSVFERMAGWLREKNQPGLADNATIALGFVRASIDSEPPPYNQPAGRSMFDIATCVQCGCDDLNACTDAETLEPCGWLRVDRLAGLEVCSSCTQALQAWDDEIDADTGHVGT